jgi:hypothetical protein
MTERLPNPCGEAGSTPDGGAVGASQLAATTRNAAVIKIFEEVILIQ